MTRVIDQARARAHRMARWLRWTFARRIAVDPGTVLSFSGDQPIDRTTIITTRKETIEHDED